jgi:histone deacetylase complex regulatory component SIN3
MISFSKNVVDSNKFEDFARVFLGTQSYLLVTIDKLITQVGKNVQALANDDFSMKSFK